MKIILKSDAVHFLSGVCVMEAVIRSKHERIQLLKEQAERVTSITDGVRSGGSSRGHMENDICGYLKLQKELEADMARLETVKAEIKRVISSVDDRVLRELLECRYIDLMSWSRVASCLFYSLRHTKRLHLQAVNQVQRILLKSKGA